MILAIDPGSEQSAWLVWHNDNIAWMGIDKNEDILRSIIRSAKPDILAIEMVQSYGMPVGKSVFETVKWIGKFEREAEIAHIKIIEVYRSNVKMYFCNSMRAKDSNIRQVLIDKFGSPGTKKSKGKLYGVKKDLWSALAIAIYTLQKEIKGVLKDG